MLRASFLLDSTGADRQLHEGRTMLRPLLGVRVVVPRSLCLHVPFDARGVPLSRLREFIRLQALAQSPFRETGIFAARVGRMFHVWMWDGREVDRFAERQRLAGQRLLVVPSSVVLPSQKDGACLYALAGVPGVEAQLWRGGKLSGNAWFETIPDAPAWAAWRRENSSDQGVAWPVHPPPLQKLMVPSSPWARNFLAAPIGMSVSAERIVPAMLGVATVGLAAYGAWIYGQIASHESAVHDIESAMEGGSSEQLQREKRRALDTQRWLQAAGQLTGPNRMADLLSELSSILEAEGLVVRELDIQGPTMTASVRPTREFRLATVIERLENSPWFEGAQFLDGGTNGALRFAWRIRTRLPRQEAFLARGEPPASQARRP